MYKIEKEITQNNYKRIIKEDIRSLTLLMWLRQTKLRLSRQSENQGNLTRVAGS